MKDKQKTKQELIRELSELRLRVARQETVEADRLRETEQLRIVGEMYRTVVDFGLDWEYWRDTEGNFAYVSPSCERITGYSPEEFKSHPGLLMEIVHPDDRLRLINHLGESRTEPSSFTFRIITRDGRECWIGHRCQSVYDDDGNYMGVRASNRDIRDRVPATGEHVRQKIAAERLSMEMALLAEIGRVIGSTLDIQGVYERFAAEAHKLIPFDQVSVHRKNPDEAGFTVSYMAGQDIPGRRVGDFIPVGETLSGLALALRKGVMILTTGIEDMAARFPAVACAPAVMAGMRSILIIPLISRDVVVGTLHFRAIKEKAYADADLRLAERIGEQIAGAVANAKLYEELKEAELSLRKAQEEERRNRGIAERLLEEMAVLAEIGRLISSTLDIREVYDLFAVEARKLIPFDRVTVNVKRPQEETFTIAYVAGLDIPGRRPGTTLPVAGSFTELVMGSRKSLLIHANNIKEIQERYPTVKNTPTVQKGMLSIMVVPLIFMDNVIGTLHFRTKTKNAYAERDRLLAERIGEQVAGAIASAHLYTQLKQTEGSLRETLDQLDQRVRRRTFELEEVNTTLRVLLKKGEERQNTIGEQLQSNIRQLVVPFLNKLKVSQADKQGLSCLNILETNLNDIVSPFINQLSIAYRNLTPKEVQVAALIRQGHKSKEIADLLGISEGTVITHRNNLRKKLKLGSRDANLRSHLISIG